MSTAIEIPPYSTVPPVEMVGPLTLLLGLIRKHEVDIFDIPIAFITERYLEAIADLESELDIELGGEFVTLAAELLHIKSLMLLPKAKLDPTADEGTDPREELVGRLLALQGFRSAAAELLALPVLGRDTFDGGSDELVAGDHDALPPLASLDIYKLAQSLQRVARRQQLHTIYDLSAEGLSIREKIVRIVDILARRARVSFFELAGGGDVADLVTTFVALLEAVRMGLATICQLEHDGDIIVEAVQAKRKAS
jgi:segregation and condensation protein A